MRISKRSGRIIPKPVELLERKDFKSRSGYIGKLMVLLCLCNVLYTGKFSRYYIFLNMDTIVTTNINCIRNNYQCR